MASWGAFLITFLIGVATGAAGNYFASKYTDRRRDSEKAKKAIDSFKRIKNQMPELIAEMKTDFTKSENSTIREFVILPYDRVISNDQQPRFYYCEHQHENLRGKISILENHGYVRDVTVSNTPIYRITEDFWNLILDS